METKSVNILGTEYKIKESNETVDEKLKDKAGYCDTSTKECVIEEMTPSEPDMKGNLQQYKKTVIRHEIIHAFLYESGLDVCSWAGNEEMVDWIAIQFPKMVKAFMEADCLDVIQKEEIIPIPLEINIDEEEIKKLFNRKAVQSCLQRQK